MADTKPLSRNVKALGVVSLLADVASEMAYPLLPLFLTATLGASATMLGAIEGVADSTSSLLKLLSGWLSDRARRKKPLVVAGYALSAFARPLLALATLGWHVLAVRMIDRTGKGVRTSPRDALLADSSSPGQRGRAFGLHRALDNVGAVLGPLLAWLLYEALHRPIREVFVWALVPGVASILVLLFFVRERPNELRVERVSAGQTGQVAGDRLTPAFWKYLAVLFVFTLSASSDAFLLVRAQQLGVPIALIPIMYAMHNLVKAASATPGGTLSDRLGRRPLILAGWGLYALVYLGFAGATTAWQMWGLFLLYGFFFGLVEGTEKALVADLVPASRRGTAFGWFHFAIGVAALPASLVFGVIWDRFGASTAFMTSAGVAAVATVALLAFVPRGQARTSPIE